ncbi:protein phosphatase [Pseudomonas fluorescens]|uniref:Serine/threonine-protein phosphatase n=1 Tax=Pseudomonas lactucae TaxID=2813360 RepID=A0A9X1C3G1_9PSED|nr:serine/threonine-protein phosphatase [Pseudomonas lactucae]MBN2987087.1 serine/threonine-protein phosphatase [Pseudomonas lactucae]OPA89358.1 protein phosphatase [Pseudomonas fluorescens]OPB08558.1 protein phosphatase [Pseudomonas fluorescens]
MTQAQNRWRSCGRTLRGKARERNEDAYLDCPQRGCWAVADGMGGHRAGDLASQWVVSGLAALPDQDGLDRRMQAVRQCLRGLDSRLGQAAMHATDGAGIMGSTVVVLLLEGQRAACIWVGDSRCYLWRGQRLYQLSRDHSLQQQLMDKQRLSQQQACAHPNAKALTRAIGGRQPLSLEVLELTTRPGDVFLLCSDGVYQGLSHDELGNALNAGSPRQVVDRLFTQVLRGAARDDLTAVVVRP